MAIIRTAPRPTQAQQLAAYKKVLKAINDDIVSPRRRGGSCFYRAVLNGKETRCGVGALMSDAQLTYLNERNKNDSMIDKLAGRYNLGRANVESLGLTVENAKRLQVKHDALARSTKTVKAAQDELRKYVAGRIRRLERAAGR